MVKLNDLWIPAYAGKTKFKGLWGIQRTLARALILLSPMLAFSQANTLSAVGPATGTAPGQRGTVEIVLEGSGVASTSFRLCVRAQALSIGTPIRPPQLSSMACAVNSGNCPAGFDLGVSCVNFLPFGTLNLPATLHVPMTVQAGALPNSNTPLQFHNSPMPEFADNSGTPLPLTVVNGSFAISQIAPARLELQLPPQVILAAEFNGTLAMQGSLAAGGSFRLCADGGGLSLLGIEVPTALTTLTCAPVTAGNCPAAGGMGSTCSGQHSETWDMPAQLNLRLRANAVGMGGLAFATSPTASLSGVGGSALGTSTQHAQTQIVNERIFANGLELTLLRIEHNAALQ